MNIKKIQELVEIMNDNGLTQVEIEQEGSKIKLSKTASGDLQQIISAAPTAAPVAQAAAPAAAPAAEAPAASNLIEITSPMVGTFYRSPAPDADSYVEVGDTVHKGDVLCIVEAMKLMNEVKSEHEGKIVEICIDNAEPLEFGQVMFRIEPI